MSSFLKRLRGAVKRPEQSRFRFPRQHHRELTVGDRETARLIDQQNFRVGKGLTLNQLMGFAWQNEPDAHNSQMVRVEKLEKSRSDFGAAVRTVTKTYFPDGSEPHFHSQVVNSVQGSPRVSQGHIRVYCDCVAGGTLVKTKQGFKRVEDIAAPLSEGKTIHYEIGGRLYWGTAPYQRGLQKTIRVETNAQEARFRFLELTPDHKVLKVMPQSGKTLGAGRTTGAGYRFVSAGSLKPGDFIARDTILREAPAYRFKGLQEGLLRKVGVRSVSAPSEEPVPVYDITIDELGAFNANGMIVQNCPRFKYVWDYALLLAGASNGWACDAIPSPVRNPMNKIGFCKHLIRVGSHLRIGGF